MHTPLGSGGRRSWPHHPPPEGPPLHSVRLLKGSCPHPLTSPFQSVVTLHVLFTFLFHYFKITIIYSSFFLTFDLFLILFFHYLFHIAAFIVFFIFPISSRWVELVSKNVWKEKSYFFLERVGGRSPGRLQCSHQTPTEVSGTVVPTPGRVRPFLHGGVLCHHTWKNSLVNETPLKFAAIIFLSQVILTVLKVCRGMLKELVGH